MAARAAEAVIEVEMAEGGIEVVQPHQADHAAAEPDAFRIAGRSAHSMLGFGKFVDFLRFLGAVLGCVFGAFFWRGGLLVGRLGVAVLRERG